MVCKWISTGNRASHGVGAEDAQTGDYVVHADGARGVFQAASGNRVENSEITGEF